MSRPEAIGNGAYSHEIPRMIEEFAAELTRVREARCVSFTCGPVIWAHNSDHSGFIPYYSEVGLNKCTAPDLETLGTSPEEGLKNCDKAQVYAEKAGALWCIIGDNTGHELERLQPLPQFGEEWHDSAVHSSIFPLSRDLQRKLGQHERQRSQLRKTVGFLGALVLPPLGMAYSGNFYTAALPHAPVASTSFTSITTPKAKTASVDPTKSPAPTATTSSETSPTDTKTVTLKVATANLLVDNSPKKVKKGLDTLFDTNDNDVVGFQESAPFVKKVMAKIACESEAKTCSKKEMMFPGINGGRGGGNQIVWKTDRFDFINGSSKHAASDPDVGGHHYKHYRSINWVHLKDKQTGQDMYFVDIHAPNAVEKSGLPNKKHKASVKAYATYMHSIVKTVRRLQKDGIPIIMVGDSNVNFRTDNAKCTTAFFPCKSIDPLMEDVWIIADISDDNSQLGTQGNNNRVIDRVFFSETNTTKLTVRKASVGTEKGRMHGGDEGSDHKPVNVVFELQITDKQTGSKKTHSFSLTLDGVKNFRDAAATSNNSIQKGVLYRSGKLEYATKSDIDKIASLLGKNGTIIDLRTTGVQAKEPDPKIAGVEERSFPIDGASSSKSYINVFVKSAADRAQLGAAITAFANSQGPTWVHCTEGKDRTGWFTAMVQYINAIGDNKQAAHPKPEAQIEKQVKAQVMREYLRSKSSNTVKSAWIEGAINTAKATYGGSVEQYLQSGLGVSKETIQKIAAKL